VAEAPLTRGFEEAPMTDIRNPGEPEPESPPADDKRDRSPFDRPPFDEDPEAQRAPGETPDGLDSDPPPMQANAREGNDNIREGRVGGVLGAPGATNGQGQGG
jgi:hypothetical protein